MNPDSQEGEKSQKNFNAPFSFILNVLCGFAWEKIKISVHYKITSNVSHLPRVNTIPVFPTFQSFLFYLLGSFKAHTSFVTNF